MTALDRLTGAALGSSPFRLAAALVAMFMIVAGLLVAVLVWHANNELATETLAEIDAEVSELAQLAQARSAIALADVVRHRSTSTRHGLYLLLDAAGSRLAGNLTELPPELARAPHGSTLRYRGASGNEARLAVARSITLADGRLVVGRDVEQRSSFLRRVMGWSLAGFGALAVTGLAGGLLLGRGLLARIESINVATRSIMAGNLSRRIPLAGTGDEIDGLADNLNAMLDRIEELMLALREVSDNIAHDLKTPLNRLRNRAERALAEAAGEAGYRDGLEHVIEEADSLIKTFNALLLIARLEAGALEKTLEDVAIGEVVRDVVDLYEPVAEEQGLQLVVETARAPILRGNRQLIGQALANLVDNAIKYSAGTTPAGGGEVSIDAKVSGAHCIIIVADRGPGIGEQDRERAVRRFVRLDKSRSKPGTGLGLSLVAAVARLHGGVLKLEDNRPGLRAVLMLPSGTQPASA